MPAQHFPNEHQADSLPVRFGGKEGAEEFSFGLFAYPRTIVNDFDRSGGSGPYYYFALFIRFSRTFYTLGCILDDIHQHLFKKRWIELYDSNCRITLQNKIYAAIIAHSFHEALAHRHQVIQLNG